MQRLAADEVLQRQLTLTTHRISTLPVVVLLPHSRCNCRCLMCDIWRANQSGQEITRDDLARHLADLRQLHVRWVVLSGGEALMHSNLWTLCALLKDLEVKISLLSTGLLLARFAPDIVRWCDEVIVSLDGSHEVHNTIRGVPRAYERLAAGLAALRALQPTFRVTARCVMQRLNYHDLPHIIDTAHALQLQQISFLAVDVATTAFNRATPWDAARVAAVALSADEVQHFEGIVEEVIRNYAADFASGFIAERPDKLRRLPQYFRALDGQGEFPRTVCNAPWVSTVIEADGTVRPCFFHRALGNIHQQSLAEILNADEAMAFRRRLDVTDDPICRQCVCTLHMDPHQTF